MQLGLRPRLSVWMTEIQNRLGKASLHLPPASFPLLSGCTSLLIAVLLFCVCCSSAYQLRLKPLYVPAYLICPLVTDRDQVIELIPHSPDCAGLHTLTCCLLKLFPKKNLSLVNHPLHPYVEMMMPSLSLPRNNKKKQDRLSQLAVTGGTLGGTQGTLSGLLPW